MVGLGLVHSRAGMTVVADGLRHGITASYWSPYQVHTAVVSSVYDFPLSIVCSFLALRGVTSHMIPWSFCFLFLFRSTRLGGPWVSTLHGFLFSSDGRQRANDSVYFTMVRGRGTGGAHVRGQLRCLPATSGRRWEGASVCIYSLSRDWASTDGERATKGRGKSRSQKWREVAGKNRAWRNAQLSVDDGLFRPAKRAENPSWGGIQKHPLRAMRKT